MGVPAYTALSNLALDRANANASVNAPVSAAELARFFNDAYADVWEIDGGSVKRATSATAWAPDSDDGTGKLVSDLTEIGEILQVWRSDTSGSVGRTNGDTPLVKVDSSRLDYLRGWGGLAVSSTTPNGQVGEYANPKVYCAKRQDAGGAAADSNKFVLEVWPAKSGVFYPIEYKTQFTPFPDSPAGTEVPDLTDIGARDMALLVAARIAPLVNRAELVQSILLDISERTARALERKLSAMLHAGQDR